MSFPNIIQTGIQINVFNKLLDLGFISDFTDDGFVFNESAGWVSVGDILEYVLDTEEYYRNEKAG